jgi:hypothetical protein
MAGTMMEQTMKTHDQVLHSSLPAPGQRGIGFVGADIPVELLLATGRPFGHLPWQAGAATPQADKWLESSFPGWARSILEQWFAGAFDALDCVVFSRADDAAQRLCYYMRELQARGVLAGPALHLLDLALIDRPTSLAHGAAAIDELARQLDIDAAAWPQAIARANALRTSLFNLNADRSGDGVAYARLFRAALWSDPTAWIDSFEAPRTQQRVRFLLAGSMPPDERMHEAVESAGGSIVDELHAGGPLRLGPISSLQQAQPSLNIARHLQSHACGPRAFIHRAEQIVARARASRAAGVILWLTKEDEALAWHVPAQTAALREAGIPLLALPASNWLADGGVLDRIADFCRSVHA